MWAVVLQMAIDTRTSISILTMQFLALQMKNCLYTPFKWNPWRSSPKGEIKTHTLRKLWMWWDLIGLFGTKDKSLYNVDSFSSKENIFLLTLITFIWYVMQSMLIETLWCWATENWYKLLKQPLTVNDNARRIVPSRRLRTLTRFERRWKNSRYGALSTGIWPTYIHCTRGMLIQSFYRWRNLVD